MNTKKKLEPPTHLDPEYLYEKYTPLRKAMFNKFKDKMATPTDKEELQSAIGEEFIRLVGEFDPNRGVDFPYYIKRMIDLRTWHYVDKYLKVINKESYGDELIIEDTSFDELFDRIIDLHSIDPTLELGEKHSQLMIGVLIHRKSLKELADEEGVTPDRLHARLYFLLKKLRGIHEKHVELHGEDLY